MARTSRRKQRKAEVVQLLSRRDLEGLCALADEQANLASALVSLLSETDDLIRWRAIEGLGIVAARLVRRDGDLEAARVLVRRQLWTMTEESGGTAWHAPEAIGEVLFRVQDLCGDFATVLYGSGATEPYKAGVHWAAARLAGTAGGEHLRGCIPDLIAALGHEVPAVRGHAARALGRLGDPRAAGPLQGLLGDAAAFRSYDFGSGAMVLEAVGRVAAEALERLRG